jgi:5-methylphenazine-1-carboxylate 1-monooxygenase
MVKNPENLNGMIVGGGIVGLVLALVFHRVGVKVRIFESVEKIQPLGVGLNLLPHCMQVLDHLGLRPELEKLAITTSSLTFLTSDGKKIWSEPRGIKADYPYPQLSIHRGDLQMILLQHVRESIGDENVLSGHHFNGFDQDENGVTARFINKATGVDVGGYEGDFLIGADGINSKVRQLFYPDQGPPQYSGQMLWRGVTEMPPFLDGSSMFMAGDNDLKLVAYPIRKEAMTRGLSYINWIAERRISSDLAERQGDWNDTGLVEEFADYFEDWNLDWIDIHKLFHEADAIYKFPMIDRDPVKQWSFDRVTLIGDAAHAMYPNGSNGVSQGILDTTALAKAIIDEENIVAALKAYEADRLEKTSNIVLANRKTGPEIVMQMVKEQCDGNCGEIHTCVPQSTLEEISLGYKRLAGFDHNSILTRKM